MKKKLLFIFALAFQSGLFAQAVPNGTFEGWTTVPYNDPTGWTDANFRDVPQMGSPTISRVSGFSGFGVRVETIIAGADTSESYAINTGNPCNDPPNWVGGVPYNQLPTAITGYYRYSLPANDSALLIVIFRKSGVHVGDNYIKIKGTGSQLTWASFSFPLSCSVTPDSMIIAFASSNKMNNGLSQNGSFLELDNLAFAGTTLPIPNGNFESWTPASYDIPNGWASGGPGVSRSATSYAGTYALKLQTTVDCGPRIAQLTTGHYTPFSGPAGGLPYTNMSDTLCGYYKYTAVGTDSAAIMVTLTNSGSPVGGNNRVLAPAATYTYFQIPVSAFTAPDTMRIDIQSSSNWSAAMAGSVLYIDQLYLKSNPLGIVELNKLMSSHYPNPSTDFLNIRLNNSSAGRIEVSVYDATGRLIAAEYQVVQNGVTLKTADLSPGIYIYEIRTLNGVARERFIRQ
jgi:hypothetical protein